MRFRYLKERETVTLKFGGQCQRCGRKIGAGECATITTHSYEDETFPHSALCGKEAVPGNWWAGPVQREEAGA